MSRNNNTKVCLYLSMIMYFDYCVCQLVCIRQQYTALNARAIETSVVSSASVSSVRHNYAQELRVSVRNCRESLFALTCWTSIKDFTAILNDNKCL